MFAGYMKFILLVICVDRYVFRVNEKYSFCNMCRLICLLGISNISGNMCRFRAEYLGLDGYKYNPTKLRRQGVKGT